MPGVDFIRSECWLNGSAWRCVGAVVGRRLSARASPRRLPTSRAVCCTDLNSLVCAAALLTVLDGAGGDDDVVRGLLAVLGFLSLPSNGEYHGFFSWTNLPRSERELDDSSASWLMVFSPFFFF